MLLLAVWQFSIGFTGLQRLLSPSAAHLSEAVIGVARQAQLPFQAVFQRSGQRAQLAEQSQRLADAYGTIAQLEQLKEENAQLRALLENRHLQVRKRQLARPVVSSIAPLVWLGDESQVQPGWLVSYKNTILGKVQSINGQYASIALLTTSPDFTVLVQTTSGAKGIARAHDGQVIVSNVPPDALIKLNERVTTIGQPGIPPGKFVGLVEKFDKNPSNAAQTLFINQLVSFFQTSVVEIEE